MHIFLQIVVSLSKDALQVTLTLHRHITCNMYFTSCISLTKATQKLNPEKWIEIFHPINDLQGAKKDRKYFWRLNSLNARIQNFVWILMDGVQMLSAELNLKQNFLWLAANQQRTLKVLHSPGTEKNKGNELKLMRMHQSILV